MKILKGSLRLEKRPKRKKHKPIGLSFWKYDPLYYKKLRGYNETKKTYYKGPKKPRGQLTNIIIDTFKLLRGLVRTYNYHRRKRRRHYK